MEISHFDIISSSSLFILLTFPNKHSFFFSFTTVKCYNWELEIFLLSETRIIMFTIRIYFPCLFSTRVLFCVSVCWIEQRFFLVLFCLRVPVIHCTNSTPVFMIKVANTYNGFEFLGSSRKIWKIDKLYFMHTISIFTDEQSKKKTKNEKNWNDSHFFFFKQHVVK